MATSRKAESNALAAGCRMSRWTSTGLFVQSQPNDRSPAACGMKTDVETRHFDADFLKGETHMTRSSKVNRRQFLGALLATTATMTTSRGLLQTARVEDEGRGHKLKDGRPEDVGMSSERVEDVFARVQQRLNQGLFPGAVALIARRGVIVGQKAMGVKV